MPANTNALTDDAQKVLSRMEIPSAFSGLQHCSKDNLLTLVDECHVPLSQKGTWDKTGSGTCTQHSFLVQCSL